MVARGDGREERGNDQGYGLMFFIGFSKVKTVHVVSKFQLYNRIVSSC